MKNKYLLTLLVLLVIASCSKDDDELTKFVIGGKNHSNIVVYNPPIKILPSNRAFTSTPFQIDFDSDETYDIEFYGFIQGYPHGGLNQYAGLKILYQDLSIAIDSAASTVMKDTTVVCIDSGEVSTCQNDPLYFYRPTPVIYNYGDKILNNSTWVNDADIVLSHIDDSNYGQAYPHSIIRESGIWKNADQKYMVFRIWANDKISYGWIKLSLTENYEIVIHEYSY